MRQATDFEIEAIANGYANEDFVERFKEPDFPATFPVKCVPVQTRKNGHADQVIWVREDLAIEFEALTKLATPISPFDAVRVPYNVDARIRIQIVDPANPEDLSNVGRWLGSFCYSGDELVGWNGMKEPPYHDKISGLGLYFTLVLPRDMFVKYRPEKILSNAK